MAAGWATKSARDELDVDEVRRMIEELGDMPVVLREADPAAKAQLYNELRLRLVYKPAEALVTVTAMPAA